jgi:hypothetical protein
MPVDMSQRAPAHSVEIEWFIPQTNNNKAHVPRLSTQRREMLEEVDQECSVLKQGLSADDGIECTWFYTLYDDGHQSV